MRLNEVSKQDWKETLIRPVVEKLKTEFPELYWDDRYLTPMGVACKFYVNAFSSPEFKDLSGKEKFDLFVAGVVLEPGDIGKGEVYYETGNLVPEEQRYKQGTIGYNCGLNREVKKMKSAGEIVELVKRQLEARKENFNNGK